MFMDKNLLVNYVTKIFQQLMESIYIKEKFMELCIDVIDFFENSCLKCGKQLKMTLVIEDIWCVFMVKNLHVNFATKIFPGSILYILKLHKFLQNVS